MGIPLRALLVEDLEDDAELVLRELRKGGYEVTWERVETSETFRAALQRTTWDIVLADHNLPGFSGLGALRLLRQSGSDLPFVIVSGTIGEELAVSAMRAGANDYLLKGNLVRLVAVVEREVREAEARRAHAHTTASLRNLEQQLLHAQKIEAVGRLAGGVAHDFNNLLTVIIGSAEMLLDQLPATDPSREDVQLILDVGLRGKALTSQLLTFSRRQVSDAQTLDLNAVVRQVWDMLKRLAPPHITLRAELAEDLAPVRADPGQLQQVLMNLVLNACDACPVTGKVTVSTRNRSGAEAAEGPWLESSGPLVELTVRDTGTGMDETTRARLFEPFFTTKPTGQGTGLGLAMCHGIVSQSGGFILVDSEAGVGTAFRVNLPGMTDGEACVLDSATRPARVELRETILLVEEDVPVRRLAALALERVGYLVLQAGSAKEAFERVATLDGPLHLIVTDLAMPELDGAQMAREVQRTRPEARVLLVSGYPEHVLAQQVRPDEGVFFLEKPFTLATLLARVREVLGPPHLELNAPVALKM